MYSIRYTPAAALGPNAEEGHVQIKNSIDVIVYDNNPGGQVIDSGEVIVSGDFITGTQIGDINDAEDFIGFREVAQDATPVVGEHVGDLAAAGPEQFDLAHTLTKPGSFVVTIAGEELPAAEFSEPLHL